MKKTLIAACSLVAAASMPVQADYVGADVNGDAARLAYGWEQTRGESNLQLEFALLFAEEEKDQDAVLGSVGFSVSGDAGAAPEWKLDLGVGGRAYFGNVEVPGEDQSGGALALGGEFSFRFPQVNRLGIGGRAYYAPDILSFGDISEFLEVALRVEYEILREATVYVGARLVRVESDDFNDDFDIDKGVNVGIRINF